jgi:hypothetical protein
MTTGFAQAALDVALQLRRQAEPAETFGERDPRQAAVVLRAPEGLELSGRGVVRGEQVVDRLVDAREVTVRGRLGRQGRPR